MKLNFLYTADNGYFDLMRLSMVSAIKYHKEIIFHVFTMDSPETNQIRVSRKNEEKLKREIDLLDPTAKILFFNVRDLYLEKLGNSVNEYSRYTPYAALRLLAPYILNDVNLVLYLDADTLVTDTLFELFEEDLVNHDFDIGATSAIDGDGIQSGSLLFNLKYQRKTNFAFIEDAIKLYRYFFYEWPDQDAISRARKIGVVLHGRYMQQNYDATGIHRPKIMCVCYRNSGAVRTFLKQSIFRLDAQKLYREIDRIAKLISDIQN